MCDGWGRACVMGGEGYGCGSFILALTKQLYFVPGA